MSRGSSLLRRSLVRLSARLAPAPPPGLRILTYHRVNDDHPDDRLSVDPQAFRSQMAALAERRVPVLPLDAAVDALARGETTPAGAVAITFDDGYADNRTDAHPVLREHGFPATLFVATALIDSRDTLDRYRGCCDSDGMLSWAQVDALRQEGWAIGGHGRTHRELAALDEADLRDEVEGCAGDIEGRLGARPRAFCYPRGSHSPAARRSVGDAGFASACTVMPGANRPGGDPLLLRRTEVAGGDTPEDFRLKLDGAFDAWHRLVQRSPLRRLG